MIKEIRTHGFTMKYCVFGNGPKTMVVLPGLSIKSVADQASHMEKSYSYFTEEYTVYIFDRIENVPEEYSIEQMAEHMAIALEELRLTDIYLFGQSQGGMMSIMLGIYHPELIKKMVLASTTCRGNQMSKEVVGRWIQLASEGKLEELGIDTAKHIYSEETLEAYRDILVHTFMEASPYQIQQYIRLAKACDDYDLFDELEKIKCPVLVMGAYGDHACDPNASWEIANKIGCQIHMYGPQFGHCVYDEAPDSKRIIMKFFEKE